MDSIKIVAIGDGGVGKTCLLATYTTNKFPDQYVPTVYDNYSGMINVDDQTVRLEIWDTAGQEDYSHLRPVSYPNTDIFLVCFSLISPSSLENIDRVWIPDLRAHLSGKFIFILVGLKSDLRDNFDSHRDEYDAESEPISRERAEEFKDRIGASEYIECSSSLRYNVKEVFEAAVKIVLKDRQERNRRSCQLI